MLCKPPCVQLINSPFLAIHQVFALLTFSRLFRHFWPGGFEGPLQGAGWFLIFEDFSQISFSNAPLLKLKIPLLGRGSATLSQEAGGVGEGLGEVAPGRSQKKTNYMAHGARTGFCEILRFPGIFSENLRCAVVVFCEHLRLPNARKITENPGEKRVYTTTAGPLFSRSLARPRGHRAKKPTVYTIFLGKRGKRVYTIGPERRVYTIEPQTWIEKKRGLHGGGVYFFLPWNLQKSAKENCKLGSVCPF